MIAPHLQEETLYSAMTFRRLLNSLACPGKINQLAYPHFMGEPPCYSVRGVPPVAANLYALGALVTLLDREVTFVAVASCQWLLHADPLIEWLILRSWSALTSAESAAFAFFCQGNSGGLITQLHRGTLLEPESSATAFYCVDQITEWSRARE